MMNPQNSEPMPAQDRRRETARQNARLQAQRTVERLAEGIATLAKAHMPINAKSIEGQTGLSYRTITRNTEAYALFCKHAAYFQPEPPSQTTRRTRTSVGRKSTRPKAAGWDPLLGRPKRQLANRLRAAEQRLTELEQAFVSNAVQQQELARRNLALEAELAQTTRRLSYLVAEHRGGPA